MTEEDPKNEKKDNRVCYEYTSKYKRDAWVQIVCEAVYLVILAGLTIYFIVQAMAPLMSGQSNWYNGFVSSFIGKNHSTAFRYMLIAKFGLIGGVLFDMKWLVHSVATGWWNCDRVMWRVLTPLSAALTAVFFALIVESGIISLFDTSSFENIKTIAAFGMLVGYFADSVMGVLSNLAATLFGTVHNKTKNG